MYLTLAGYLGVSFSIIIYCYGSIFTHIRRTNRATVTIVRDVDVTRIIKMQQRIGKVMVMCTGAFL